MALFWLSNEAWAAIEPHLPKNQPGARRVDDRQVISGILHVLKVGCRWCDCPAGYDGVNPPKCNPIEPQSLPPSQASSSLLLRIRKSTAWESPT